MHLQMNSHPVKGPSNDYYENTLRLHAVHTLESISIVWQ